MGCECGENKGCCESCGPVLINAQITGEPSITTHDGRETMVIPVVAIVEGVLNGALVTAQEFGKFAAAWEGVPVPVYHPQLNGQHVSSSLPQIIESSVIGRFHNVAVKANKLVGELWIDTAAAIKKGFSAVINSFKAGEVMEVSTAYFADTEPQAGEFNGVSYSGIHHNLRPDHLAVLPGETGACSVADGCGTFQNSKTEVTDMSDKAATVQAIIEASDIFTNEDTETLMSLDESKLSGMLAANEDKPEDKKEEMTEDEDEDKPEANSASTLDQETLTAINWCKQQYTAERDRLVAKLTANSRCDFDKSELQTMQVDFLAKLDKSLSVDYSGRGLPVTHSTAPASEEVLEAPLTVLAKEGAK